MGRAQGSKTMAAAGRADHNHRHHTALPPLTHDGLEGLAHAQPQPEHREAAHHTALPRFDSALGHVAHEHEHAELAHTSQAALVADAGFGSLFGGDRGRLTHPVKQRYVRPDMPRIEPLDGSQRLSALLHSHPAGSSGLREKVSGHCHALDFADEESVHTNLSPRLAYMRKGARAFAPETKLPQELDELADYLEGVSARLDEARAEYAQLRVTLDQIAGDSALSSQETLRAARAAFDTYSQCGETFLNAAAELAASAGRLKAFRSTALARLASETEQLSSESAIAAGTVWELSDFLGWPVAMQGTQPQPAPQDLRAQLSGPDLAARVIADASAAFHPSAANESGAKETWLVCDSDELLAAVGLDDERQLKVFATQATGHEMPHTAQDRLADMAKTANGRSALLTGDPVKLAQTADRQATDDNVYAFNRFQSALARRLQERISDPALDELWSEAVKTAQEQLVIKVGDRRYREQDLGWHLAARHQLRHHRRELASTPRSLSGDEAMRLARHLSVDELVAALRMRAS